MEATTMLDGIRAKAFTALRSSMGNALPPVRWTKDLLLFVNEMAGKPLAPEEELAARRGRDAQEREARDKRIEELRMQAVDANRGEAAPVTIYIDEKSTRELKRIRTVLKGRDIVWRELDVESDLASKSWVKTTSGRDELPVVFVGEKAIGAYDELVQLDVKGELVKMVFGK